MVTVPSDTLSNKEDYNLKKTYRMLRMTTFHESYTT